MASVKFYLRTLRSVNEATIVARFTKSATERFQLNTDERINPRHWDARTQAAKPSAPDYITVNLHLTKFKSDLLARYRGSRERGESFEQFKAIAQGTPITDEKKSLRSAFERFLAQCAQDKDVKTWKSYRAVSHHLFGHIGKRPVKGYSVSLDFADLDWNFYDDFRSFLLGKGLIDNTVYKTLSKLKSFLAWAQKRDYPVNPVFKDWKIVMRVEDPIMLSIDELQTLEAFPLMGGPAIGRDYFCVEARTGQRISDTKRFNARQYDGNKLTFYRTKGHSIKAKEVRIPDAGFCSPAFDILRRHKFKLPEYAEPTINEWIKEAFEKAGLTRKVTKHNKQERLCDIAATHMGRKTFITLALQFMPPKIVMDLAGIDSYQTLKHYEGKSEDGIVQRHLEDMEKKLKVS